MKAFSTMPHQATPSDLSNGTLVYIPTSVQKSAASYRLNGKLKVHQHIASR